MYIIMVDYGIEGGWGCMKVLRQSGNTIIGAPMPCVEYDGGETLVNVSCLALVVRRGQLVDT